MNSYSSKNYNEILSESILSIKDLEDQINISNKKIEERLKIIKLQDENSYKLLNKILESGNDDSLLLLDSINNDFGKTGITVHPKTIGSSNNVLNLSTSKNNIHHFREDVIAKLSDNTDVTYILKHDSIQDKDVKLIESEKQIETITISKTSDRLGAFIANAFEIDTYIKNIINIIEMNFFKNDINVLSIEDINDVGFSLHPLNNNIQFDKVTIKIESKETVNNKYIYPIKHLYFYNSLFDNTSFCVYKKKLDKFLSHIENKVKIKTDRNEKTSKLTNQGIKIYMDEELSLEVIPDIIIGKDVDTLFIKIPLFYEDQMKSYKSVKIFEKYR